MEVGLERTQRFCETDCWSILLLCWLVGKKGTIIYTAALSKNLLRFFSDDMLMKICCFGGFVCSKKENYQ